MWTINQLSTPTGSLQNVYNCDGLPLLNYERSSRSGFGRLVIGTFGYLDLYAYQQTEQHSILWLNGTSVLYSGNASLSLQIESDGSFLLSVNDQQLRGSLTLYPPLGGETIDAFREMMQLKMVPYQDPPSGTPKSNAELQALANEYFPGDPYGFDKAMALYDWTSASFIRQDLFHQLQYTGIPGSPLDLATMARVIWGCDYPGYSAQDANFMHAMLMQPASSEEDVYQQLLGVYERVKPLAIAEMQVMQQAILGLSPVSATSYPELYRGAMPMTGGYDTSDFAPSMFEYPGNWGPEGQPLVQALNEALNGCLKPGSIITTKGPWSFSNDLDGAKVWQNGILITCRPPQGAAFWPGSANITPFSLNPDTFEINMPPPTRYRIESYAWETINGKPVCHFQMTLLGYCVKPMEELSQPPE
ncbi:hypothetical protein [Coraliomargarita akajimensis]|uniref:Uncharacterized protein n=1 Tax=Coraliomargarita akajimensis (strain DSM 45221 / IAM 15411 / JCM 23193 / KCTC 12865 / 04OKA010-24) TaxID=583355 RepID=D5EPD8_CORAD|nr:hypothetical protein [Coraliomargarita akajimensis]ADE53675.1 hypothetical protein Caka_0650 [Coraliomargarita akajimensis DSM 45221]